MDRSHRVALEVPLAKAATGSAAIIATVHLPQRIVTSPTVVVALPGGGYSRGYFDLKFPGRSGYSEAEYQVAHGNVFVAMDHLGVGESSTEANDRLVIEDIAAANDAAVRQILQRLRTGALFDDVPAIAPGFVVGTGQSMGGGVTIIMQGRHRTYDAIAPLGYSAVHTSLPQRNPEFRALGKKIFAGFSRQTPPEELSVPHTGERIPDFLFPFHFEDVPEDILKADMAGGYPLRQTPPAWGSATIPRCVVAMMSPGYVAPEANVVDVPVFLGFGERDVSEDPSREPSMFPRSRDVTVYSVPTMAHMHNFASTRRLLWERVHGWMNSVRQAGALAAELA